MSTVGFENYLLLFSNYLKKTCSDLNGKKDCWIYENFQVRISTPCMMGRFRVIIIIIIIAIFK